MAPKLTPEEAQIRKERIAACTSLEDLQAFGQAMGYKEGWAVHAWDYHPNNPDRRE